LINCNERGTFQALLYTAVDVKRTIEKSYP
jgi:hypothetical protein